MRTVQREEFERKFGGIMHLVDAGERLMIQRDGMDILRLEPVAEPACPAR